jgi:hydroxymethylbilane synthase
MVQTHLVIERLQRQWPGQEIAIEQIRTTGDRVTDLPLTQIGGDGVFVTEIERALQERRIDLAVHSLKDLPTVQPEGLRLVISGPREDARDVFIANEQSLLQQCLQDDQRSEARFFAAPGGERATLNQGADLRIGTSSLRRTAQLRALWPFAQILPIRGNVDTRLRKLEANEYDAIVLAAAGLHRLDLHERLADRVMYFPVDWMLPAPGQGALALEIRDEPQMCELLFPLEDPGAEATTTAERMFMRRLGAGCYLPVAAYGKIAGETLTLLGLVISLDGQRQVRVRQMIPWTADTGIEQAQQLGISLAEQALAEGADEIIGEQECQRV